MSQTDFKRRLQALMNRPENQECVDCTERQPRWASLIVPPPGSPPGSLPFGVFMCLECSGSHRRLGVHLTFVRSINLDSWKEKEVLAMERGGNKKINLIFEGKLQNFGAHSGKIDPRADGRTREKYIRDKYERRKFFDAAALQRFYSNQGEDDEEESEEESSDEDEAEVVVTKKKVSTAVPAKIPAIRAPSEAAKLRAESRKARLNAYRARDGNTAYITHNNPSPTVSHPVSKPTTSASQDFDLLGFDAPTPTPAATKPVHAIVSQPPVAPQPTVETPAALDLFSQVSISSSQAPTSTNFGAVTSTNQPAPPAQKPIPMKKTNEEILSMFNNQPYGQVPYNSNNPAANAISNLTPNMQQQQQMMYNMQQMNQTQQAYRPYPHMMQQPNTGSFPPQQNNALQFQQYNGFQMSGVMGGGASNPNANAFTFQQASTNGQKLDRNGFPLM